MRQLSTGAATLFAVLVLAAGSSSKAQAPCATGRAVVDSARDDVLTVLGGEGRLVAELRQEQGINVNDIKPVTVTDRAVCAKIAAAFNRLIAPGVSYAVLRVGPMYYARDPDQRRATGVFTDSSFKVLMRLGAELPSPRP